MDPLICAQLILSRMKKSGELDDILNSALRPSFRMNWYETQTYEYSSLPEGYFDDMIQYIIDESAKWSVTDYNAHCLVLCLLQQKIIVSMGLDITHPTDVRASSPTPLTTDNPTDATGSCPETTQLATDNTPIIPTSTPEKTDIYQIRVTHHNNTQARKIPTEVTLSSDEAREVFVKARWRAPQKNRKAGKDAEPCRHCGLMISKRNMARHVILLHKMPKAENRIVNILSMGTSNGLEPTSKGSKRCRRCKRVYSASNISRHMALCKRGSPTQRGGARRKSLHLISQIKLLNR